jgi:hypothetical protein
VRRAVLCECTLGPGAVSAGTSFTLAAAFFRGTLGFGFPQSSGGPGSTISLLFIGHVHRLLTQACAGRSIGTMLKCILRAQERTVGVSDFWLLCGEKDEEGGAGEGQETRALPGQDKQTIFFVQ